MFTPEYFFRKVLTFLGVFAIAALFSAVVHDGLSLAHSLISSAAVVVFFSLLDLLKPSVRRMVHMVLFGSIALLMTYAALSQNNTTHELAVEIVLGLYCAYCFYDAHRTKT